MVEEHGMQLLYLPAYLPDLNLIELAFSNIKSWPCTHWDCINLELDLEDGNIYDTFWAAVYLVTGEQARGWYKHSGYVVTATK